MGVEHLKKSGETTPCKEHIIGPECDQVHVVPESLPTVNTDNTVVYVPLTVVSVDMPELSIGTGVSAFPNTMYVYPYTEPVNIQNDENVYPNELVVNAVQESISVITGSDISVAPSQLVVNVAMPDPAVQSGSDIDVAVDTEIVEVSLRDPNIFLSTIVPVGTGEVSVVLNNPSVPQPTIVDVDELIINYGDEIPVVTGEMLQDPSIAITSTDNINQTKTIVISNMAHYPSTGVSIRLELYDTTNSVSLGHGIYTMGTNLNAPASSSGASWTMITSNSNNPIVTNGMSWSFSLFDWLQDKGDYGTQLARTIEVRVKVIIGASESSEVSNSFSYSHSKFQLNTTRNGLLTITLNFNSATFAIIDYGDGTNAIASVFNYTLTKTYSSAASKNLCVIFPDSHKITVFQAFGQNINSIEQFDVSSITTFRMNHQSGATTMTGITWPFNAPNCTYFQLSDSLTLTTLPSVFNLKPTAGTVTLAIGRSKFGSFAAGMGMSGIRTLDISSSQIVSLPLDWNPTGLISVNMNSCTFMTTLPAWTINNLQTFTANSSTLTAIPSSWYGSSPTSFTTNTATNFAVFPDFNWSACTLLACERNKFTTIPSTANLTALVQIVLGHVSINNTFFTTWGPTSIGPNLTSLYFRRLPNFSQAEVDDTLAQLKASWLLNNRNIVANFELCAAPSAAGLADKAFLNANGCTVTTA